jgi:phosphoribosylamine--glycine ligase
MWAEGLGSRMDLNSPINVLLIGSGGREHALALGLSKSPNLGTLYATDMSNPAIAQLATEVSVPVIENELYRLNQFCDKNKIDLVVIGPEDPLAQGWGDELGTRADGTKRWIFGPGARGAQLEADKALAKQFMRTASIPTAESRTFDRQDHAEEYLRSRDEVYVIKAAGLAKGKGVFVPSSNEEGLQAIDKIMNKGLFGDAGKKILVEELLSGTEVSVLALMDNKNILILPPCQDHKRLGDNDDGPNTGGMGAFCPAQTLSEEIMRQIESDVFVAAADALRRDEIDFHGVLYAGIMLTPGGPKVLEFNVRFGDPECQPLLSLLESDLLELLVATASGRLDEVDIRFSAKHSVCVVIASAGYPESPEIGKPITGVDDADAMPGVTVFHAGTALDSDGVLVTSGGRVLGVTATGETLEQARDLAYEACAKIHFEGMQLRSDIASSAAVSK